MRLVNIFTMVVRRYFSCMGGLRGWWRIRRDIDVLMRALLLVGVLGDLVASHGLLRLGMCLGLHLGYLLLALGQVIEPGMLKGVGGGYAHLWSQLKHAVEKIKANLVDLWQYEAQVLGMVDGEVVLVLGQLRDAWP